METLVALRRAAQRADTLSAPRAELQLRSGAIGGNPVRVTLRGDHQYVDEVSSALLDVQSAIDSREPQLAYVDGGFVPPDTRLVVTSARFRGQANGDNNGRGALRVVIGGETLLERADASEGLEQTWSGRIEITPGTEGATYIEVSNSSALELVLEGEFVRTTPAEVPRRAFVPEVGPRPTRSTLSPRLIATQTPVLERIDQNATQRPRAQMREPTLDVEYAAGELRARAWSRSELALADLGAFNRAADLLNAVEAGREFPELRAQVRESLRVALATTGMRTLARPLEAGHAYFLVELAPVEQSTPTLLFAGAVEAGVRCELERFELHSELGASGSLASAEGAEAWARAARYLERQARAALALAEPRAEFQFRAATANGSSVDLAGQVGTYVNATSDEPLDLSRPLRPGELPTVHRVAGRVPAEQCFVVTRIDYSAAPGADTYRSTLAVLAEGEAVFRSEVSTPGEGVWQGEFVVRPGEEQHFVVEARNVATARVVLTGHFEPLRAR